MLTLIDLSHPIADGMVTYPGLPAPEVGAHLTREASPTRFAPATEFHIGCISMVGNTGTYLATPFHRFERDWDLADLDVAKVVAVPGLLVDGASNGATGVDALDGRDVGGRAVLVRSGWDRRFNTDHYGDTAVLGAGIPVVEHLRGLDTIPDAPFAFSVRAYATI